MNAANFAGGPMAPWTDVAFRNGLASGPDGWPVFGASDVQYSDESFLDGVMALVVLLPGGASG